MNERTRNSGMVLGEVASSGLARGTAVLCACANRITVARRVISSDEVEAEMVKLDAAIAIVEEELMDLQKKVQQSLGDQSAGIFEAHIALLRAPSLRKAIRAGCLDRQINVEAAVEESIEKLASTFAQMEDPYLRERAADLEDIGNRLLAVLTRNQPSEKPVFPQGSVLVTSELLPSVTARLDSETIRGVIVEKGGQTAHATILARELGVPLLIRVPDAMKRIRTGDRLIVDGLAGRVFINPTSHVLREYDRLESDLSAHRTALQTMVELPAVTSDGTRIRLSANIGKTADATAAAAASADGVGLYRTEFVFLVQDHLPSEEEQYRIYRATAEHSKPLHVVIRLLDIGGDKPLHYFPLSAEANPSLGLRGTRLLLAHGEILRTQARAILRLSATHPVSILLPMVGDVGDVRAVKTILPSSPPSSCIRWASAACDKCSVQWIVALTFPAASQALIWRAYRHGCQWQLSIMDAVRRTRLLDVCGFHDCGGLEEIQVSSSSCRKAANVRADFANQPVALPSLQSRNARRLRPPSSPRQPKSLP